MKLVSTNPSKNYEPIGEVEISTPEEIYKTIFKAKKAFQEWSQLAIKDRVAFVQSVARIIEQHQKEIAKLISQEMGKPIKDTREEVKDLAHLQNYLDTADSLLSPKVTYEDEDEIHTVTREPWGVVASIVPWNFPLGNFIWQSCQPLLAGNTVVFKHSEETPLVSKLLEEIVSDSDLPEGVFNVIYGDGKVGDELVHGDIDLICFTGSSAVGQNLYKIAAEKFIPVVMELGGSAPGIVFEDNDIDSILESIYFNRFINNGQACDALKRLIVHKSQFDEVVEKLSRLIAAKKVGDPLDEMTDLGPLVAKRQLELLESQVQDAIKKGAKVINGGKRPEKLEGAYYLPTLLTNIKPDMRVWREEVFGPVLPVIDFETEEEAVSLANDTIYGLGAYVFTEDKNQYRRVAAQLQSGMVAHNNVHYIRPENPFGGYKRSGLGREHAEFGFHDVTQVKVISEQK